MAVSFKTDSSFEYGVIKSLGVSQPIVTSALACGVTVDQSSPGVFEVWLDGKSFGVVKISGQAMSLIKSNSIGPASKSSLAFQFEKLLKDAIATCPSQKAHAVILTGKPTSGSLNDATGKNGNPTVKTNLDVVLGSYVKGTTPGSKYVVVGVLEDAFIAFRMKGLTASFRLDGANAKPYFTAVASCGFQPKGKYASAHYSITDSTLLMKTFGAICGVIGLGKFKALGFDPSVLLMDFSLDISPDFGAGV